MRYCYNCYRSMPVIQGAPGYHVPKWLLCPCHSFSKLWKNGTVKCAPERTQCSDAYISQPACMHSHSAVILCTCMVCMICKFCLWGAAEKGGKKTKKGNEMWEFVNRRKIIRCPLKESWCPPCVNDLATGLYHRLNFSPSFGCQTAQT